MNGELLDKSGIHHEYHTQVVSAMSRNKTNDMPRLEMYVYCIWTSFFAHRTSRYCLSLVASRSSSSSSLVGIKSRVETMSLQHRHVYRLMGSKHGRKLAQRHITYTRKWKTWRAVRPIQRGQDKLSSVVVETRFRGRLRVVLFRVTQGNLFYRASNRTSQFIECSKLRSEAFIHYMMHLLPLAHHTLAAVVRGWGLWPTALGRGGLATLLPAKFWILSKIRFGLVAFRRRLGILTCKVGVV